MAELLDTQLISYAIAGRMTLPANTMITSVTAHELLLTQGKRTTQNRYYIPLFKGEDEVEWKNYIHIHKDIPRPHRGRIGRGATDRLIFDFSGDHPTVVEYSHVAISSALNTGKHKLLSAQARALSKKECRTIDRRLKFIQEHDIKCIPLGERTAATALKMFAHFVDNYTLKSNFRNSLNDILSFAIAVADGHTLATEDDLLGRFMADFHASKDDNPLTSPTGKHLKGSKESKGFVNRPWAVRRSR
ncbi:hypothetical protein AB0L25_06590 [Spirillospora sp. NPDC052242]